MQSAESRVLIIEDQEVLRVMLFTVLRHQPVGVDTATNADEALQKVRTCDYALILLDVNLANDDAGRFLATFRGERPEATSFIIAVRDPRSEVTIEATMVDAVLNKPLELDTLAEVVRECALVVPPPDDPLPSPPAESDLRAMLDNSGSFYSN
jgi:DNA-binding response OmpR family regulator